MSPEIPTTAEARLEARKKVNMLALKIWRRRRTILKNVHRFSEEFGLRAYVHLEKKSRYGATTFILERPDALGDCESRVHASWILLTT